MKNSWQLIIIIFIACCQHSVFGEDVSAQIEEINRAALSSNEVDRDKIELQLLSLIGANPGSESRGSIYAAIANMYGNDMNNFNQKATYYAREALKNQINVVDTCKMYLCLGRALEIQEMQSKASSNSIAHENIATPYIQGLAFLLDHLRADENLSPPAVGKFDVDPNDPLYQIVVSQHEQETAFRNDVLQQNQLRNFRDDFSRRVLLLCPQPQVNAATFDNFVSHAIGDTNRSQKVLQFLRSIADK